MSMTVENVNVGTPVITPGEFRDGTITFGGADTLVAGTILATVVSAPGTYQIYVKGGVANGNGVPVAVLTYEVVATGVSVKAIRPMITGKVQKEKLVIDADGDDSNIDGNVIDDLINNGIIAINASELNIADNQ